MTSLPSLTKSTPPLPDWRGDKKLVELTARRDRVVERGAAFGKSIATAHIELVAAQDRDRQNAAARLLGRSTDDPGATAAAQAVLDQLIAEQQHLDAELPAFAEALAILVAEAKAVASKEMQGRYRAAAKRLAAALDAASVIHAEVRELTHHSAVVFDSAPAIALFWPDLVSRAQRDPEQNPNPSRIERLHDELAELGW